MASKKVVAAPTVVSSWGFLTHKKAGSIIADAWTKVRHIQCEKEVLAAWAQWRKTSSGSDEKQPRSVDERKQPFAIDRFHVPKDVEWSSCPAILGEHVYMSKLSIEIAKVILDHCFFDALLSNLPKCTLTATQLRDRVQGVSILYFIGSFGTDDPILQDPRSKKTEAGRMLSVLNVSSDTDIKKVIDQDLYEQIKSEIGYDLESYIAACYTTFAELKAFMWQRFALELELSEGKTVQSLNQIETLLKTTASEQNFFPTIRRLKKRVYGNSKITSTLDRYIDKYGRETARTSKRSPKAGLHKQIEGALHARKGSRDKLKVFGIEALGFNVKAIVEEGVFYVPLKPAHYLTFTGPRSNEFSVAGHLVRISAIFKMSDHTRFRFPGGLTLAALEEVSPEMQESSSTLYESTQTYECLKVRRDQPEANKAHLDCWLEFHRKNGHLHPGAYRNISDLLAFPTENNLFNAMLRLYVSIYETVIRGVNRKLVSQGSTASMPIQTSSEFVEDPFDVLPWDVSVGTSGSAGGSNSGGSGCCAVM